MSDTDKPAEPIRVYRFSDAPSAWQDVLCCNGGDEDWLAIVPKEYGYVGWISSSDFGCCSVDKYIVDESGTVYDLGEYADEEYRKSVVGSIPELANHYLYVGCHA